MICIHSFPSGSSELNHAVSAKYYVIIKISLHLPADAGDDMSTSETLALEGYAFSRHKLKNNGVHAVAFAGWLGTIIK